MRFTSSIFTILLLWGVQSCKNDQANQQTIGRPSKQPEASTVEVKQPQDGPQNLIALSAEDFDQCIQNNPNVPLIDLRPEKEFKMAHIGRAINITYTPEGFTEKVKYLTGANSVLIYDASGIRSVRAAKEMEELGIQSIKMLDQGIYSWAVAHKMQVTDVPGKKR